MTDVKEQVNEQAEAQTEETPKTEEKQVSIPEKETGVMVSENQRGFESGIDNEDLIIPRAKLIQALSPELAEGIEGIKVGTIINSLTKEILPFEFIPVFAFKTFIRFNPRSKDDANFNPNFEPGAVMWKSSDPLDPKVQEQTKFGENGEKPLAVTFLNFFSYFEGSVMPVIVSFSKTSYKTGRQLLSLGKFCQDDLFSRKYKLTSAKETNDIGTYAVFKVATLGRVSDEEYKLCEQLWKDYAFRARDIQVHEDEIVEEPQETRPY